MKNFIKDYLKLIAYATTGLVFVFASFYLMMNYNHNEELKKQIYIGSSEVNYLNHQEILSNLNKNLTNFNSKKNTNASFRRMANSLRDCYNVLQSKDSFANIETNKEYTAYEIYKLGSNFQTTVLNMCWNNSLSYLKNQDNTESNTIPQEFKEVAPFIESYVSSINNNISDSLKEIENNSSYFYTTNITSATSRN